MDTRRILRPAFAAIAAALFVTAQSTDQALPLPYRITGMSDAEVIELTKSQLDRVLCGNHTGDLHILAAARSSLVLPMIRAKIEEVLKTAPAVTCSTGKSAHPERIIFGLSFAITGVGNLQSLLESSKLLKIDERRFNAMVRRTMYSAINRGNPFTVAYQGLEIGDPAIDKRLIAWAEELLEKELPHVGDPIYDGVTISPRRLWAEALVDRYGAPPTPAQWRSDPLASRLKPSLAILQNDVRRFAAETAQKRAPKQ